MGPGAPGLAERGRLSPPAQHIVFQAYVRAVTEHTDRLQRLEQERHEQGTAWRLCPGVDALHALRGVPCPVAVTTVAALGDLTRVDTPRQRMHDLGLTPSEYARGERRRQGGITKTGNTHARRALVEGAWASRYPAKVRRPLQLRLEKRPKPIQDVELEGPGPPVYTLSAAQRTGEKPASGRGRDCPGAARVSVGHCQAGPRDRRETEAVLSRIEGPKEFQGTCSSPLEETPPRYGVPRDGVKR